MFEKEKNAMSGKKLLDISLLISASEAVFGKEIGKDFIFGIKKSGLLREDSFISSEDFNLKLKEYASNFHKYQTLNWDQTPLKRDNFPSYL